MVQLPALADLTLEVSSTPSRGDLDTVDWGLESSNRAAADLASVRPLACFARAADGQCVGGAVGRSWGRCCEVQELWVEAARRGRGIGTRLMCMVEAEAQARACTLLYLDTFTFQAPRLYQRLGFEIACTFEGFPDGIVKLVLRKQLA